MNSPSKWWASLLTVVFVLGISTPAQADGLVYAALGDSFSAGEGNPAFEIGTDVAGPQENRCHRSQSSAYPLHLGRDPMLNLNAPLFVACSGAEVKNVADGQWNEGPQLAALGWYTDLVTISVGGNDVYFRDFATACVLASCDRNSKAFKDAWLQIRDELLVRLVPLYRKILQKAPNAEVYVVGYPMMAPRAATSRPPFTCGDYLTDGELHAIEAIIDGINRITQSAIMTTVSHRLHFVDPTERQSPFRGHEMCSSEPYFHGISVPFNVEYSFHPNEAGQRAYARWIREVILRS